MSKTKLKMQTVFPEKFTQCFHHFEQCVLEGSGTAKYTLRHSLAGNSLSSSPGWALELVNLVFSGTAQGSRVACWLFFCCLAEMEWRLSLKTDTVLRDFSLSRWYCYLRYLLISDCNSYFPTLRLFSVKLRWNEAAVLKTSVTGIKHGLQLWIQQGGHCLVFFSSSVVFKG